MEELFFDKKIQSRNSLIVFSQKRLMEDNGQAIDEMDLI
jgi:hypothetical protein